MAVEYGMIRLASNKLLHYLVMVRLRDGRIGLLLLTKKPKRGLLRNGGSAAGVRFHRGTRNERLVSTHPSKTR